jgi:methyl-accepting chemotaxis protein
MSTVVDDMSHRSTGIPDAAEFERRLDAVREAVSDLSDGVQPDEESLDAITRAFSELGELAQEADGLGIAPLGQTEAKTEISDISSAFTELTREVMDVCQLIAEGKPIDDGSVIAIADRFQEVSPRLRRLLAPTNAHYLSERKLYALPTWLAHLPGLLLIISREPNLAEDVSGRLFILANESEFYSELLALSLDDDPELENQEPTALPPVEQLRVELETIASAETPSDVAQIRKRLNDALDAIDGKGTAVDEVLARISKTTELIEVQRTNLDHLVAVAREQGASWNKIARAVGVSAQSAHKRWDPEAKEKARRYMQEYSVKRRDVES